ncbi:hypothetical protein RFM99_20355 [Mesorhizobium sp. VK4C]|uniref:hypothetical protein n=1 Tax=Mesorhizobium captivum TaxID=3072319 RepID=UPI002A240040|nr:hypothetical protein [Mesorhizobium sp. VK4C]MDX8500758.1 hypothetical protein [Mesorhizobium sp. VK4C]
MTTEAVPFYRTHIVLSPVDNPPNKRADDGATFGGKARKQGIIIIDRRALARDCLVSAIRTFKTNRRIEHFSTVHGLLQQDWRRLAPSLLVYCYHETGDNPEGLEEEVSALNGAPERVPFVLVADVDDIEIIDRAFQVGMCGFVPSTQSLQVLMQAVAPLVGTAPRGISTRLAAWSAPILPRPQEL